MKSEGNSRGKTRTLVLVLLLLFIATHAGMYLLGWILVKAAEGEDQDSRAAAQAAMMLPGKSVERSDGDVGKRLAGLGTSGFRGLLAELERPEAETRLTRQEFLHARAELFREWLRRDPRTALDLLYRPESEARYASPRATIQAEIRAEILRNPAEIADWIAQRRYGSNTVTLGEEWVRTLLVHGQAAVVLRHLDQLPMVPLPTLLEELSRHADAEQLAQIRSRFIGKEELDHMSMAVDAYARRMVRLAGGDLAKLFAGEESTELDMALATNWVEYASASLPPREAVAALMQIPEDLRQESAQLLLQKSRRGGYGAMVELLGSMDAQGLVGDDTAAMVEAAIVFSEIRPRWHAGTPAELLELARVIPRDDLRRELLRSTMGDPGYASPEDLLAALPSLPPGGDRDAMLVGLAEMDHLMPDQLEALLAAIGDRKLVEDLKKKVAEREGGGEGE